MNRKLRMGMVGGGPGAFIGEVHRKAAQFDGGVELVAGCFSQQPEKSRELAASLFLDEARAYASYSDMVSGERGRPEGDRIDFVSIVTPNNSHAQIATAFLDAGFHVVLDKPMTLTVAEALALRDTVKRSGCVFALTHNYTGYPMVKLARDLVRQKELGRIVKIVTAYPQGWLAQAAEQQGVKQAEWRTDPARSGAAGCMGDIGTHAENLSEYITGLQMTRICADLSTTVAGRRLDDDGNCLVHYENGVRGLLYASQVCVGALNGLRIQVYGEKASLCWEQENPNELHYYCADGRIITYRRGTDAVAERSPAAVRATRLPFGHPEAFYEAFATIYRNATDTVRARIDGREPSPLELDFPDVDDGVRGMKFIEAVVKSSGNSATWVEL